PERVSKLVLINPLGLWRQDKPVTNWMALNPQDFAQATFYDTTGPAASALAGRLANAGSDPESVARYVWAMACTGKYTWPIPDRGLSRRIHRIAAPTLIIWGRHDGIVPLEYAQEFASRIAGAR